MRTTTAACAGAPATGGQPGGVTGERGNASQGGAVEGKVKGTRAAPTTHMVEVFSKLERGRFPAAARFVGELERLLPRVVAVGAAGLVFCFLCEEELAGRLQPTGVPMSCCAGSGGCAAAGGLSLSRRRKRKRKRKEEEERRRRRRRRGGGEEELSSLRRRIVFNTHLVALITLIPSCSRPDEDKLFVPEEFVEAASREIEALKAQVGQKMDNNRRCPCHQDLVH